MLRALFFLFWNRLKRRHPLEGVCKNEAKALKAAVQVPVLCTGGGVQDAALIREVIAGGYCDGVSIARPLIANNDLPQIFERGDDLPSVPCSFCNRCLVNAVANPLGCYDQRRFGGDREKMIEEIMTVFKPAPFWP